MMLKTKAMHASHHQFGSEFPVRSVDGEQAATDDTLGRAAFINVDVRGLGTNHCLMRAHHSVDSHGVGTGAVKHERHDSLFAEMLLKQLLYASAIFIVAICQCMFNISVSYSL